MRWDCRTRNERLCLSVGSGDCEGVIIAECFRSHLQMYNCIFPLAGVFDSLGRVVRVCQSREEIRFASRRILQSVDITMVLQDRLTVVHGHYWTGNVSTVRQSRQLLVGGRGVTSLKPSFTQQNFSDDVTRKRYQQQLCHHARPQQPGAEGDGPREFASEYLCQHTPRRRRTGTE